MTLEKWDRDNQYFEARLAKTQAILKVGIEHVMIIDEREPVFDPRDNLQVGRDEEIRIVGKQMFRKTKCDHWRKQIQEGIGADQTRQDQRT